MLDVTSVVLNNFKLWNIGIVTCAPFSVYLCAPIIQPLEGGRLFIDCFNLRRVWFIWLAADAE